MRKSDINKFTSKKPIVMQVNSITIREKMNIIHEYYKWLCMSDRDANSIFSFIEYEDYLKRK